MANTASRLAERFVLTRFDFGGRASALPWLDSGRAAGGERLLVSRRPCAIQRILRESTAALHPAPAACAEHRPLAGGGGDKFRPVPVGKRRRVRPAAARGDRRLRCGHRRRRLRPFAWLRRRHGRLLGVAVQCRHDNRGPSHRACVASGLWRSLCLLQEEHGNHLFTAVFGARSVATVIIDDDVAFVWDSRTSGDGTEAGSFEWYLGVGQHSFVVEYVEEAGPDTGGNAFLTWAKA